MSIRPFYDATTHLYWILKGRAEQGIPERLKVGQMFTLEKTALFNYPSHQVLLVCNDDFVALAYARVLSFEQSDELTRVHCEVVKTLEPLEQHHLTQHLQTTQKLIVEL
ncbi:MAG: hypothetical protein ACRCYY_13295 [Trueperaceae bacterium]